MTGLLKVKLAKGLENVSKTFLVLSDLIKGAQACITLWEFITKFGGKQLRIFLGIRGSSDYL